MIQKFNPNKIKYTKFISKFLSYIFTKPIYKSYIPLINAENVLIIDPTGIGDIVMLTSFLRILKLNNPKACITLVCEKYAQDVLISQNLVYEFIDIKAKTLNSPLESILNIFKLKRTIHLINKSHFDYAIEPRGDLRYILFMYFCSANHKVSYNYTSGDCLLTDVIIPSKYTKHLVEDKLYLLKELGCKYNLENIYPRLYLSDSDISEINTFKKNNNLLNKTVIGVHPGASQEIKVWNGYSDLIRRIRGLDKSVTFIFFQGPNEEVAVSKLVRTAEKYHIPYIISCTSIHSYMLRLALCDAVFCNDSGAGHIASAYGVPVFVIFGPVDPELAKPYSDKDVFVFSKELECKPCMRGKCMKDNECIKLVSVDDVFTSFKNWLFNKRKYIN